MHDEDIEEIDSMATSGPKCQDPKGKQYIFNQGVCYYFEP